jgi:hypothetical protein
MSSHGDSHSIRNNVIASVVTAALLAVPGALLQPGRDALAWSLNRIRLLLALLTADWRVPGWLLVTLCGLAAPALFRGARYAFHFSRRRASTFHSYTKDNFYGATWRWNWEGEEILGLWCFCPTCDAELAYDDSSCHWFNRRSEPHTDFICEHCGQGRIASIPGGNKRYAISAIEREIRRKLRTGETLDKTAALN